MSQKQQLEVSEHILLYTTPQVFFESPFTKMRMVLLSLGGDAPDEKLGIEPIRSREELLE